MSVLLWIAIALFVLWILGLVALPSLGWFIHVALVVAIILVILHFVQNRSRI